jgi:putative FmdB family regulatory protein
MPSYEYQCEKCAHQFDALQKMSDEPLKVCPECKGDLKRLISGGAGVIFKGSGFYQTDYKKNGSSGPKSHTDSCGCSGCHKQDSCPSSQTQK